MDVERNGFCKPSNLEGRLRLRKNDKKSTDNKVLSNNNESNMDDTACTSQPSLDESILDFKSPKRIHSMQSKVINSNRFPDKVKKKVLHSKSKIIINEKTSKNGKPLQKKKIFRDVQQPLIESSFFKSEKKEIESPQSSTALKTAFVCPLCFKNLKDENSQAVHMKSCAMKNNMSTKKLMDAVELQERQAAERKSLGLLSAPILQDKKKFAPRKIASHDDPDLQLALALSKSLYEKEEMEEWDEVQIVAISSNPSVPDNNAECPQKATLQNFGFSSSRNVLPTNNLPTSRTKKRKLIEPTILQRRTALERERILTERIAEILMGCKDFTQRSQEKIEEYNDVKERIDIKSQLLQQLRQIENTLWDRTKLILTKDIFYVKQLSPQIIPLEKKEQKSNEEKNIIKLMELNINNERSLNNEQMQEIKEIQDVIKTTDTNEALTISSNIVNICCKEKQFLDNLATSWRNILNDSSASDIIVFVRNSKHIWTHKLVFYTRCANILLDVISNDTEFSTAKEKICWLDTDYDVAMAFLEFVYCGVIDKYSKILDSQITLSGIRALGRKYKINDLFVYLRQKKSKSIAELNYNTYEKSIENVHPNIETTFNVSKLNKSFNKSPNCTHNVVKNIPCSQKTLLQGGVNDDLYLLENNYAFAKNLCVLQDEKDTSLKLSEEMNFRSNTPAIRETSASPDMFDETFVMKHSDKSTVHPKDLEDSNIHILLNLLKQDADVDIYSQKLSTAKPQNTERLELDKSTSTCLKNLEQSIEINPDVESNSLKRSTNDMHKNFLIDTSQSNKSRCSQDLSKVIKQKSNLTLFIEEIQKENAESDALINATEMECSVQISPIKHKNPFCIDKYDNSNLQSYDNDVEQSVDSEKKPGRLSIIEQRMQSYAAKNPEFYSRLSNEDVEDVKQTNNSHIDSLSSEKITESSHNNISNCTQNFTSSDERNVLEQITTVPTVCSQHTETMNRSFSETIFDLETNEEEISMYSKYMRDHKDNSIAKYRRAISRNKSDNNLSNKSTLSDSLNEDSNVSEAEKDEILTRSVLTQKDADVIVSSDSDVESISSNVSHILENNDSNCKNIVSHSLQQSRKEIESNKQDMTNENNSQFFEINKFSKEMTTCLEEEKNINSAKLNPDKLNTTEIMSMTQKYKFNELNDAQKKESIPSPIMVSSSPDFLNNESCSPILHMESLLQGKLCTENVSGLEACKLRKSATFSFDFEDDIYLANVDVDKYEKQHILEKSRSFNISSMRTFNNSSARRSNDKNNHENIKGRDIVANDYGNLDNNFTSLTQNFTSVKKFKRKSLSEGQINTNRLYNKGATSTDISRQFQCNYIQNIGNAKTPKITDKDVTPPPVYNDMSTPELHKEMKKYGLKVQKRSRAVKLLTHIYNELHPLVPEKTIGQQVTEISSDEDEEPPLKKRNMDDNGLEKSSNSEDSENELPCSQDSNNSISPTKETLNKEMEFYETESSSVLENSSNITEAFMKLINIDKALHNKILQYEPVNIDHLRCMLQTHGFKCKLPNLMNFLDQQCITFYSPEQNAKRIRRKA
ncbi:Structure-specific endonuclease subunit SLX4 [Trachymyrmex cornetzi]|uniref:Structure-specific endonuclease subunit SLX4 n=2 Tax=Trachymyrmex cornetzi TaxID=471704 RepID=A0A151ISZ3_9HYME|nr:Structure-specific endonuclease subunit SLX4 [Trachymyrmex cornetzi]